MGKRGRPRTRPLANRKVKEDQCYTLVSSDDDVAVERGSMRLPSPTQRRGVGNERVTTLNSAEPARTLTSTNENEEKAPLKRAHHRRTVRTTRANTKQNNASGDSDATEV